jgi:hypothetical protein
MRIFADIAFTESMGLYLGIAKSVAVKQLILKCSKISTIVSTFQNPGIPTVELDQRRTR